MKNLEPRRARWMRLRIGLLAVFLLGGSGIVLSRAWELQVQRAPELKSMAEEQYLRDIRLSPKRGTIFDRNGAPLAVSADVDSVWANPRQLRRSGAEPAVAAARLSVLLGVDAGRIEKRLRSNRFFVWIKRRVSPAQAVAVERLQIPGVSLTPEARRFYPNRELAAHILGFSNVDGRGIEGLELHMEEQLRGSVSSVPAIRDRRGVVVFSEQLLDDRAARGDDVTLTIDKTVQYVAERELELAVKTFEARGGSIVVLDPKTGEILAMANYPSFNPNEPSKSPVSHRRNRAVTDRFEPGSTIKPFTVAGALARGAVRPREEIDCQQGEMEVAEYTIHDTHKWDHLTPGQILVHSSNIGTAKIGMAMGRKGLYQTLRGFGFGSETGIELPGETPGILRDYKRWYDMDAATISFGQGMSSTVLQLASAMGALANDGKLLRPMLVKRVTDARGEVVTRGTPRLRRHVVPRWAARMVSDMLVGVTGSTGTGVEAAVDGHLVAGKTGTAQKADYVHGGYAEGKWSSSFVGYAPAQRPRVVISVLIDEPVIAHHGGSVAGPVFRRVASATLAHLGVPAEGVPEPRAKQLRRLRKAPEAPPEEPAETDRPSVVLAAGERQVPDLSGHTARAALVAAREAGLEIELQGTGLVIEQLPPADSVVQEGSTLEVRLAPPSRDPAHEQETTAEASTGEAEGPALARSGGSDG